MIVEAQFLRPMKDEAEYVYKLLPVGKVMKDTNCKWRQNKKTKTLGRLLVLKPDLQCGFCGVDDWQKIRFDYFERAAYKIFLKRDNKYDHPFIMGFKSAQHIISYLRYGFKSIIMRTRLVYVDNNYNKVEKQIIPPVVGCGFFEPLLICFAFAETFGYFKYAKSKKGELSALRKSLNDLKGGYNKYSKELQKYFRHGLAHQMMPKSGFEINLNIDTDYVPPCLFLPHSGSEKLLKINIPHFIDSLIYELESYIENFKNKANAQSFADQYIKCIQEFKKDGIAL